MKHTFHHLLIVICFFLLICTHSYGDQLEKNMIASKSEIYVWFETNTETYLQKYIAKKDEWSGVGKRIVTARIFNIETFILALHNEGINDVIGGFKTSDLFKNKKHYDQEAWEEIAMVARRVSDMTNGLPVVLENEGMVKTLLDRGETYINYDELLKSISRQTWPREIWFWYAPLGKGGGSFEEWDLVRKMSYSIADAVKNGIPNARLIEASSAGFNNSKNDFYSQVNFKITKDIDTNPISIVYLDEQRQKFWQYKNILEAIKSADGNPVILYPGFNDIDKGKTVENALNTPRNGF